MNVQAYEGASPGTCIAQSLLLMPLVPEIRRHLYTLAPRGDQDIGMQALENDWKSMLRNVEMSLRSIR